MGFFRFLQVPQLALAYVILALIVAMCGRDKAIGFWGFFLLSLVLTPILPGLFLLMARDRKPGPA